MSATPQHYILNICIYDYALFLGPSGMNSMTRKDLFEVFKMSEGSLENRLQCMMKKVLSNDAGNADVTKKLT